MKLDYLITLFENTHYNLQNRAMKSVDLYQVARNWLFGFYLVEYEQKGDDRAEYGKRVLERISNRMKSAGIKGISVTNLKLFRQFFEQYRTIRQTLSDELKMIDRGLTDDNQLIGPTLSDQLAGCFSLSWSHYVVLLQLREREERSFYEVECQQNGWSVRELKRQVDAALYERIRLNQGDQQTISLGDHGQPVLKPKDIIKDPYILEFLGLEETPRYSEHQLETAIIDKLESFLLELGKGFLFEARQKRFSFEEDHFYVDLVFYNRLLRCYVLIDLKLEKLSHQDLGQMQMYVNYFDRYVKTEDENPTVGILLCRRKNDSLVELTLPENSNIYASRYQLYLPSKEELKKQIEIAEQQLERGKQ